MFELLRRRLQQWPRSSLASAARMYQILDPLTMQRKFDEPDWKPLFDGLRR